MSRWRSTAMLPAYYSAGSACLPKRRSDVCPNHPRNDHRAFNKSWQPDRECGRGKLLPAECAKLFSGAGSIRRIRLTGGAKLTTGWFSTHAGRYLTLRVGECPDLGWQFLLPCHERRVEEAL